MLWTPAPSVHQLLKLPTYLHAASTITCSTPAASSLQPRAAGDNYPPLAALPDPLWETPSPVHRGRLAGAARSLVF